MIFNKKIIFAFLLLISITNVISRPFRHQSSRNYDDRLFTDFSDSTQNYLMSFGYLPMSNIETGNLRTETQLREAIKNLQRFAHLPETGHIDEETIKLMNRPRCGVPDAREATDFNVKAPSSRYHRRSKRYVIQGQKWKNPNITWSLVNQTMSILHVGKVRKVLREALDVWARHSKLTFTEVYDDRADIQVLFAEHHGDGYDFDGPGQVLAHAFYPGNGRGGDAHFDADETWTLDENEEVHDGTSLLGVAAHEFGHSLGLGHSSVQGAIMFPWYHGYQATKDIPDDDKIAIQQIYGTKNDEKQWGPSHRHHHHPHRTNPPTTTTTTTTTTERPQIPTRRYYPDQPRWPNYNEVEDVTRKPIYRPTERVYTSNCDPRYDSRCRSSYPRDREYLTSRRPYYPKTTYPTRTTTTTTTTTMRSAIVPYYPERRHHNKHHYNHHENDVNIKPDTCDTSYDAITIIRNEVFIFKDRYLWRIGEKGLIDGYPHEIRRLWSSLPYDLTHVDTVYENKKRQIVFFIGKKYYIFNSNILLPGYPKPLTDLGLPRSVEKIDAALIWSHNNRTYFYSGTQYWRFDEDVGKVELDYPRDIAIWGGIKSNIDSAFQHKDGKTYFFKGKGFWQFNDQRMHIAHLNPKLSATEWMGCDKRDPKLKSIGEFDDELDEDNYDDEYDEENEEDEYTLPQSSGMRLRIPFEITCVLIVLNMAIKFFYS